MCQLLFAAASLTPLNILSHHLTTVGVCFGRLLQTTGFVNPGYQEARYKPLIIFSCFLLFCNVLSQLPPSADAQVCRGDCLKISALELSGRFINKEAKMAPKAIIRSP